MNNQSILKSLLSALDNRADDIMRLAEASYKSFYGVNEIETDVAEGNHKWLKELAIYAKNKPFDVLIYIPIFSAFIVEAWRISAESPESMFYWFPIFLMISFTEALIIYQAATGVNRIEDNSGERPAPTSKLAKVARVVSALSVGRLSGALLGWTLAFNVTKLNIVTLYIFAVGAAYSLDYQLGLHGDALVVKNVLVAFLPMVVIGILSDVAGERAVRYFASAREYKKRWRSEALDFVLEVLYAKAAKNVGYAIKALDYYDTLIDSGGRSVSSDNSESSVLFQPASVGVGAGFMNSANARNLGGDGIIRNNGTNGTTEQTAAISSKQLKRVETVLSARPDILDDSDPHGVVADLIGIGGRGRTTTIILDEIKRRSDGES